MILKSLEQQDKINSGSTTTEDSETLIAREDDLISRIVAVTRSTQSERFYRQAIKRLGSMMVEELLSEMRYQIAKPDSEIRDSARYFTTLLTQQLRLAGDGTTEDKEKLSAVKPKGGTKGTSYMSPTALELFEELKPRDAVPTDRGEDRTMDWYSKTAIPWATFAGPDFFTLSNDKHKTSDTVLARFRSLDGKVTIAPLIRGKNSPDGREYGVLTVEHGRMLAALEYMWLRQGAKYTIFAGGRVLCYVDVSIREIARHMGRKSKGGKSFGGRDLKFLKRLLTDLKTIPYYIALERLDAETGIRRKGFSFYFLREVNIVDLSVKRKAETVVRVEFSDQYSRQLLQRRVVSRPLEIMNIRNEVAWLIRLYLEPILISRNGDDHAIELLRLIDIIHLPKQRWQQYKSQRKHVLSKAVKALNEMKTIDGRCFDVRIEQGLNQQDYMIVARLVGQARAALVSGMDTEQAPQ